MARPRLETDKYLSAIERARQTPGEWIEIPKTFRTETDASITAHFLREGYLRVKPRPNEPSVRIEGNVYLATSAPVEAESRQTSEGWELRIRAHGT